MNDINDERYFITALARGLDVLACFTPNDKSLSNQQIAQRCKLPKSTVTRITYTLTRLGYLSQHDDLGGRYAIGARTLSLGSTVLSRLEVRPLVRPAMQQLADFSGATVSLGVRDRLAVMYVEVCRSASATSNLTQQVGSRVPMVRSATGRAYLARAGGDERRELLEKTRELDEIAFEQLGREIERAEADVRQHGCVTSFGEWQPEVNGVALGFVAPGTQSVMVISCGGARSRLSEDFLLNEVRPRLLDLVAGLPR